MRMKRATSLALSVVLVAESAACGPRSATSPPTTVPTSPRPAASRCGDGLCDDAERADPALCPQDCALPLTPSPSLGTMATATTHRAAQPNIVFILTDDLDSAAMQHMPNLRTLMAEQGVTLSNFFISMPLCCPSRATILRGQYGHNTEIMGNDLPYGGFVKFYELGQEESTVATWLQGAGYRTMLAGKYLNGFPDSSDPMHIPDGWTEWYSPVDEDPYTQYDYILNENGRQIVYRHAPEDYGTDVYLTKTTEFIADSVQAGQPFFAHVSLYTPHWPTTPAPRHADLFSDATAPRTSNWNEDDVSDKPSYIRNLPPLTEEDIARIDEDWRNRLRSIQALDELIESLLNTLQELGQLENTYLFFTSDNGYHYGSHRQVMGKTSPYEEDVRVTMVVRGPGVPAGKTLDHLTGNVDLAPTWAQIAGVEAPDFVDGRSLLPLLGDSPPPTSQWRTCYLLEHAPYEQPGGPRSPASATATPNPGQQRASGTVAAVTSRSHTLPYRGIRTAQYLYVEYPTDERELYDLRNDPYQLQNIVTTAEPAVVQELAARLAALATCSGQQCRTLEDEAFGQPTAAATMEPAPASAPLIYYLGYATQDNMSWIQSFGVDVLTRGFLLFLNSNDAWLSDYRSRMQQCQGDGRQFLVALQAAVLVEDIASIPSLGPDDPALAFPMDRIPQWEDYACRTADGQTLKGQGSSFAHACLNNAEFRAFLQEKLEALVDSGADGVHIDEFVTRYFAQQEGYCDACLQGFRNYLAEKYSPAELKSRYNIADVATFDFRARLAEEGNLQTPPQSPLHGEWWLYQLTAALQAEEDLIAQTKAYAQAQGRPFLVSANSFEPEQNPDRALELTLTDFATIGTGMTIRVRKGGRFVDELRLPPSYSYVPLYRMALGVTPDKPVTLFIDGPGGTEQMKALSEREQRDVVRWMFAEAYAAGARFHVPYPSLDYYAPLQECQQYVGFIRDNQAAYDGAEHLADVGVLFSYASEIWDYWVEASGGEPNHSRQYYGLAQALNDLSIQYDVVFAPDGHVLADDLTLDDFAQYETLLVPWAYSLNDHQVQLLQQYVQSGKELIVIGELATFDEGKNPRSADVTSSLAQMGAATHPKLDLEGYLADPRAARAGAIRDEVASWIPDRLVAVSNASVTAQLSRNGDALYCHLINRDLGDSGFELHEGVQVRITLPAGLSSSATQAVYASPDLDNGQPSQLSIARQGDRLQVTVPKLEVYGLLTIPLTPLPTTPTAAARPAPAPTGTPPARPAPVVTGTARPSQSPPPAGKCGDGVCDEMEQKDPALCPADCAAGQTTPAPQATIGVPTTGTPDYEPPINVFLILHTDELGDLGMAKFKPEPAMYTLTRNEIDWLMGEAARHGLHFTSLYNGWFTKMALEMNDLSQFSALLAAGHEIGAEAHPITYDEAQGLWVYRRDELSIYGRPNYDPAVARQAWADSADQIDAILAAIGSTKPNRIMCSTAMSLSDERNLMAEFGLTIAPGNRLEASVTYLGHMSWNPWRAANSDELGYEVAEDLSSPYVSLNHGAQIGESVSHSTDVTVPQLQRQFLLLYAEWLSRERSGAQDRVWSIGFVHHPNQGTRYNADLAEFLDWLDEHFIAIKSVYGHTIARYATVGEIVDEFLAWEAAHPGVSSFHYVRGDPYSYTYAFLAQKLKGTDYEAQVDLGAGVSCFRFSNEGQPIYLLWSDQGQRTVDLSREVGRQARVTDATGKETTVDATALPLTEEPLLVEPQ